MTFCKYAFPEGVWEQLKPLIQHDNQYVNCAVVLLPRICIASDEQGNCTQYDSKTAVDIFWKDEIPSAFDVYEVTPPPCGVHTFQGMEHSYIERFCKLNPDSDYSVSAE